MEDIPSSLPFLGNSTPGGDTSVFEAWYTTGRFCSTLTSNCGADCDATAVISRGKSFGLTCFIVLSRGAGAISTSVVKFSAVSQGLMKVLWSVLNSSGDRSKVRKDQWRRSVECEGLNASGFHSSHAPNHGLVKG
jgi:hypothetical protein